MKTVTEAPPAAMQLVAPRGKLLEGMPTSGLFIIVGQPKSGKSTFVADAPGSYVLELERGGGDRVAGRIHDIMDLAQFRQVLPVVMKDPSINVVAIDTLDVLSDWLADEIARARGLETITERKAGVDGFELWGEYRARIEGLIGYFKASGKLVILVAHCREPKVDGNGNTVTPAGINMPGKAGGFIAAQADMIGYAYKKPLGAGTGYYLTFQGGPLGTWGSRVDELNDRTLTLPRENPYSALAAVFAPAAADNGHKAEAAMRPGKTKKQGGR